MWLVFGLVGLIWMSEGDGVDRCHTYRVYVYYNTCIIVSHLLVAGGDGQHVAGHAPV